MKNKIKRGFWKKVAIGSLVSASAATVFGISLNFIKKSNSPKQNSNLALEFRKNYAKATLAGVAPYTGRKANEAPESLYLLDIGDNNPNNVFQTLPDIDKLSAAYDGLKKLGVNDDIVLPFIDAILPIYQNRFSLKRADPLIRKKINAGISFFQDVDSITKQFKIINGFNNNTNDELKIYSPTNVYNINEAGRNSQSSPTAWDLSATQASKVEYKVGEIDLNKLQNQDKVLDFTLKDESDANAKNHDFHLIMNNIDNGLVSLFDKKNNPSASDDINDAINQGKIILRDNKENYVASNAANLKKSFDKISLFYDQKLNRIQIIAKPNTKNSKTSPLIFKATNPTTQQLSSVGFLDTNFAPSYRPINFIAKGNTVKQWPSGAKTSSHLKIHRSRGKQEAKGSGQAISFWLAEDEKMSVTVEYVKEPTALTSGNTITYVYDGTTLSASPSLMSLNVPAKIAPTKAKVNFTYDTTTIATIKYAKLHLETSDDAFITINQKNEIVVPGSGEQRIFFEDPSNQLTPPVTITNPNAGNGETQLSNPTKVTQNKDEYIKSVFGAWYNLMGQKSADQWVIPLQAQDQLYGSGRIYDFNYEFYYENANKGIVKATGGFKDAFLNGGAQYKNKLLVHNPKTFNPDKDPNDSTKYKVVDATGENVAKLLSDYFNALTDWLANKFKEVNVSKSKDFYKPTSIFEVASMVTKLKNYAPTTYAELDQRLTSLLQLASEGYAKLPQQDQNYIDNLEDPTSIDYAHIESSPGKTVDIKGIIQNKIKVNPTTGEPIWSPDAIKANKLIIVLVEREVVKAINEIIKGENKTFEGIYSSLLGKAMSFYLEGENGTYDSISQATLKIIDDNKLSTNFKGSKLVSILGNPKAKVNNGKDQLKSLLDFIANFGLQEKYLDATDASNFKTHYGSGDILKKEAYTDSTNRAAVGQMVSVIDKIVKRIVGNDKSIESLSQIMREMEQGAVNNVQGANKIKDSIDKIISKITSSSKGFNYKVLSKEYQTSYIQNLAMGKNLSTILDKWVDKNKNKIDQQTIEQLKQTGLYDPKSLVNLAISLRYYNFEYFISSLTEEPRIPQAAEDMLNSDFGKEVVFKIPKSNSIIDAISNPSAFLEYAVIGAGVLLSLVGMSSFAISLTKSSKQSIASKRSSIIMKALFIGIAIIGIGLAGLGILIV